jgi:hypothetical protein
MLGTILRNMPARADFWIVSYEDGLAILLDDPNNVPAYDGSGATFSQVGCWMTCHNSMRAMPNDVPRNVIDHTHTGARRAGGSGTSGNIC